MLITPAEINTIAYIVPADIADFKPSIIKTVEEVELPIVIGNQLLGLLQTSPESYPNLLESYVKPFMAYRIKYLTLRLRISDQNLTPDELDSLLESTYQAELLAKANNSTLQVYVFNTYGITPSIVAGILIDHATYTILPESPMPPSYVPVAPFRAAATAGQSVFYLPQILNSSSLVFVNDSILPLYNYTGIGSDTLTLNFSLHLHDYIVVTF